MTMAGDDYVLVKRADLLRIAGEANVAALRLGEIGLRGACIETRNEIHKLLAAPAPAGDDAWLPIESAPKDEEIVLWGPKWINPGAGCIADDGAAYEPMGGAELSPKPTHWQPLPQPPSGEVTNER
jgi:hypothetical protein